jgi:hypothetical protein
MSTINERRLGPLGDALERDRAGHLFRAAKWGVRAGLALRFARGHAGVAAHHVASALYLASGLAFRYAWVEAGKVSAGDDRHVAAMGRRR